MKAEILSYAEAQRKRADHIIEWLRSNADELTRVEQGMIECKPFFIRAEVDIANESIDIAYSGGKLVLKGIFKALRDLGYAPNTRPKDEKLSTFSCYWNHPTNDLRIWLSFSSTMCKRIKVGTKMVSQDIYETVCDE
jgi:hypothetical protein